MTTDIEVERHVADWLEEGPRAGRLGGRRRHPDGRRDPAWPEPTYGSRTMRWIWAAAAVMAAVIAVAVIRPFSTTGPGAISSASPPPVGGAVALGRSRARLIGS
jgi:hypothetical protein